MARLNSGTRIYGSANVDGMLVVGQITPNNANVGLANTGSLQVWGGAYISGNTTIGGQSTTEQVYVQGNSNLLTYSQNLENAAWNKNTATVRFGPSANTYAPDGTNTVSQIINTTGGVDTGSVDQYFQRANRNTPYTFSAYVKQGSCPFAQINMYVYDGTVSNASANVNFSTGTVAVLGVNLVNSTFVPVGGGWYRVSITLNSLVHSQIISRLYLRGSGVAGEFGYFWGAQLEPGITPSAYANTSSGNIVKANNNLFVMGNTFVLGGNTSISNTTGSLIVHGGLGVSGNVNVSNTLSIITQSNGNVPFIMQPGVVGVFGARFGVVGEILDLHTSGSPLYFSTNGARVATQFVISHTASAVNWLQATGNTTGGGVVISGQGSDTNIGININPKGAGSANVTSTANSTSNTSGALVITGGMGITGNLFMSAANNYSLTTSEVNSYRLGWTDNYFTRSPTYNGVYFSGSFLAIRTGPFYIEPASSLIARGVISNDSGNNTVIFAPSSPVRLQNTAASTSNTTGSLIVGGGIGVTGNVVSNSFITSTDTSNYLVRIDGFTASGPKIEFGSPSAPNSFMAIGAYNGLNNFETGSRNFRLGSTTVTNIMLANAATGVVTFANNVIVSGNLTVIGNVSVENVQSFAVSDPLIQLGIGNYTSDLRDIGFAAHYNDGTNAHTGFIRDSGTKEYYLFQGYTPELSANNNIVLTDPSFRLANVYSSFFKGNVITGGSSFITIAGNTTSSPSTITSGGSDADVSMNLVSKGAGSINFIARGAPVVTMASGTSPFSTIASPFIFSPTIPGAWGSKLTLPGNATATIQTPDSNSLRFGTFGGTGVGSYSGNTQFEITHTGSAVNYLSVTGNTTGGGAVLSAQGSDTNVGININPKGAGSVNITSTAVTTSTTTGALVVSGGIGVTGNVHIQSPAFRDTVLRVGSTLSPGSSNLEVISAGTSISNFRLSSCSFASLYVTGTTIGANIVGVLATTLNIGSQFSSSNLQIYTGTSSPASLKIYGASTGPAYANIGSTTSVGSQVNIISSLPSTSNTTGALVVTGGVGISGNVYADNVFSNNAILLTANNYTTYADPVGTAVALAIALG